MEAILRGKGEWGVVRVVFQKRMLHFLQARI